MKIKFFFILTLLICFVGSSYSQRFALVDVNKVLDNMDDYKKAQEELDRVAASWKQEIAIEYDRIKAMYNKYQAEQVLLTEDQRKQKEEEITNKEKEVRKLQKDKFGEEGELFRRRQDLVRPIQDRVYTAIQDFALANTLDAMFDTSGSAGIIYYNKDLDKTEAIIKKLKSK
ncbi:MAG: OmpH family outer membrane protein [Saprospiraceae bacterium]|nr:OmpH family outer membrane protein [Saprospiraceae bacterium]MBK8450976.1 OmpH family outer membrane protein [Saprospiraceae bacterium]MBK8485702.1 OmpH family outer membrane protein [Saprospiraceae bacterium]MBK9720029.1 OmpH family outer membrane protein [Saprospiraceae bacterium]MBK9727010.1 OmpH family outer membrane protein [Saprospiraceae bacterium]